MEIENYVKLKAGDKINMLLACPHCNRHEEKHDITVIDKMLENESWRECGYCYRSYCYDAGTVKLTEINGVLYHYFEAYGEVHDRSN